MYYSLCYHTWFPQPPPLPSSILSLNNAPLKDIYYVISPLLMTFRTTLPPRLVKSNSSPLGSCLQNQKFKTCSAKITVKQPWKSWCLNLKQFGQFARSSKVKFRSFWVKTKSNTLGGLRIVEKSRLRSGSTQKVWAHTKKNASKRERSSA